MPILDEATDKWGIKVNRVELKNIMPPHDIQVAMEKQMRAERERRESILQAEGDVGADVAGVGQPHLRVHVGAVHVDLPACVVHGVHDLADAALEHACLLYTSRCV